jgi:hypothetical protein
MQPMNTLEYLSQLITAAQSMKSRPVDPHDEHRFRADFGPSVMRLGPYVIYTASDAKELNYGQEVYRILKEMMSHNAVLNYNDSGPDSLA